MIECEEKKLFSLNFVTAIRDKSFYSFTAVCSKFAFSIHNKASSFQKEFTSFGLYSYKVPPLSVIKL